MTNYRKIYEKAVGEKIEEGYEIHHIDFDRNNNNILNLVALPKCIHREYHTLLLKIKRNLLYNSIIENEVFTKPIGIIYQPHVDYARYELSNLYEFTQEISDYEVIIMKHIMQRNETLKISYDEQINYEVTQNRKKREDDNT